jgi:hypothetical protein
MSEEKKNSIRDAFKKFRDDPETNQDQLLAALKKYSDAWLAERKNNLDRTWSDNAAFYAGNHYTRNNWSDSSSYRVRIRENHTNNVMARLLSIVSQNLPIVRCFPANDKPESVTNADNTEKYGKYYWRTRNVELKYLKHIRYGLIFGHSFIVPQFDPTLGGKLELTPSETKSGDPEVREYRGDVTFNVADPFKILVRPGIDERDDMYDFIYALPVNKGNLEDQYGEIEADPITSLNVYTGQLRRDEDMVLQYHYYHKPTNWFEEGMYACWVGGKILKAVTFPYQDAELPLIDLPFDKRPLAFYGMSGIEQVMDLQEQLNRAASMIVEARNLMMRPRVFASHEANVPGAMLNDRPGEIIRYKMAGGKPEFHIPGFNFQEMAAHKGDVRNALSAVIGITNASRGEIPAATKTALALQLVLEQDRSQYSPFIKQINRGLLDLFARVFSYSAQFISEDDPRVVKIEGSVSTTGMFHGGMVPDPLDLWLEDTNPLGWTAAGRVEQIGSLIDRGVIKDENKALDMLRLNSTDPAYDLIRINRNAQLKENEELNKGGPVEIGSEDDDHIHLEEITKVMAAYEFRHRPKAVQDAYMAHAKEHKQRLVQAARVAGGQAPSGAQPAGTGGKLGGPNAAPLDRALAPADPGASMENLLSKPR